MPTPPQPLARSNYLNWPPGPYNALADPNNPAFDPSLVLPVGGGYVAYGDAALDAEQYQRPLERLHGMGLHASGVGFGMQLVCPTGMPNVGVLAGLALDPAGRHIFLAAGGSAEIDPNASVPGTPPNLVAVDPVAGAILPTAGYGPGEFYVVVQWWETWGNAAYASDPNISQYNDTPWLQLVTAGQYTASADLMVILGAVELDAASNVTSASYGDVGGLQRSMVSLPAQSLQLFRAVTTPAPGADQSAWGEVRAREAGGIEVAVKNGSDQVNVLNDAGGNFSSFGVGANQAVVGELSNPGITLDGAEATVRVGAPGNYGDVLVFDSNNHLAVSLIGDTGHVIVGGETLAGEVRMKNANAADTMTLNGDTGSAVVQRVGAFANNTIDVDTRFLRVHAWDLRLDGRSGNNNRALVDWGNQLIINYAGDYGNGVVVNGSGLQVDGVLRDGNGVPLMGNPARKVMTAVLAAGASDFSNLGGSNSQDIVLPSSTQFTAIASCSHVQQDVSWGSFTGALVAEIFQVDGNDTGVALNSSILGNVFTPIVSQGGQTVTFRVRAGDDSYAVLGNCAVYFE